LPKIQFLGEPNRVYQIKKIVFDIDHSRYLFTGYGKGKINAFDLASGEGSGSLPIPVGSEGW